MLDLSCMGFAESCGTVSEKFKMKTYMYVSSEIRTRTLFSSQSCALYHPAILTEKSDTIMPYKYFSTYDIAVRCVLEL